MRQNFKILSKTITLKITLNCMFKFVSFKNQKQQKDTKKNGKVKFY